MPRKANAKAPKTSVRLRRDQLVAIAGTGKELGLTKSSAMRLLIDEAIAARTTKMTGIAGFQAGWNEGKFEAWGMIKKAMEGAFSEVQPKKRK